MQHLDEVIPNAALPITLYMKEDLYGRHDCTIKKFMDFPRQSQWRVKQDYTLEPIPEKENQAQGSDRDQNLIRPNYGIAKFIQAWLFFGLTYTVLQGAQGPLLEFDDMRIVGGDPNRPQVSTSSLNMALKRWKDYMEELSSNQRTRAAARIRMIRVEAVLQHARNIVRENCGRSEPGDHSIPEALALSLMVLGEALTSTKIDILKDCHLEVQGWHAEDDDDGWGPSKLVSLEMEEDDWCPNTVDILRKQLKSHATLMHAAQRCLVRTDYFRAHVKHMWSAGPDACTSETCTFRSGGRGDYVSLHSPLCKEKGKCKSNGPSRARILEILSRDNGGFPLVTIKRNNGQFDVEVDEYTEGQRFAAISHVWADGMGNEKDNQLPNCQLENIWYNLSHVERGPNAAARELTPEELQQPSLPFWMDTLLIPVLGEESDQKPGSSTPPKRNPKEVKKKAIRQIHKIFQKSAYTIVVDGGLSKTNPDEKRPCQAAMTILFCGWMKRLWTLQEAFLSKTLWIQFKADNAGDYPLKELWRLLHEELEHGGSVISALRRHLSMSLMHSGSISKDRNRPVIPDAMKEGHSLVVDAWRAARWRDTTHKIHEPLALSTLMGLNFSGSDINAAGLDVGDRPTHELDRLASLFWKLFHDTYRGGIPSGLIFLPGEKVDRPGFGWAPRSFMTALPTEHPDPLAQPRGWEIFRTELDPKHGLLVRYPGFILHCENGENIRKVILGTKAVGASFSFPGSGTLLDWYKVEHDKALDHYSIGDSLQNRNPLAIILTRPNPREEPREIGLLVEIYHRKGDQELPCCHIIRRIFIQRDAKTIKTVLGNGSADHAPPLAQLMPRGPSDDNICIGEPLGPDQLWYIDRKQETRITRDAEAGPRPGATKDDDWWKQAYGVQSAAPAEMSTSTQARGSPTIEQLPIFHRTLTLEIVAENTS